jgi:FkbM family methyltransferase
MAGSFRSPRKVARRLRILPAARRELRSWVPFTFGYAWGVVPARPYVHRNGGKLRIGRGVDHVPIIEVWLRRDYGVVPDDATILDIGASTGVFAVYAAASAPRSRVISFEPMPSAFALLERNVALNGFGERVQVHHAAVAAETGEIELFVDGLLFPSLVKEGTSSVRVPSISLADVLERHAPDGVDLLKLDIEGAEYDVLYGAAPETLARIAEIRMEAHDLDEDQRSVAALRRFFAASGFTIVHDQSEPEGVVTLWAKRSDSQG